MWPCLKLLTLLCRFVVMVVSIELTMALVDSKDPTKYDHIVIRGLPYDRGFSYGSQAKEKIVRSLTYYKSSTSFLPWSECLDFVKENYLNATAKYYPRGFEEMRGIADGSGTSLEDIMILNGRYDLARIFRNLQAKSTNRKQFLDNNNNNNKNNSVTEQSDECTGAIALSSATASGDIIIGQNWDINKFVLENDTAILLEVHPDPSENIQPMIMLTEAGQLGRTGMNLNGLGLIAMSLWSTGDIFERDPVKYPDGFVPVTLLRRMFLEQPTFSLGLRALLRAPRHVSVNMMVATSEDEALNIELTPDKYFVMNVPVDTEILTHSNHFKTPYFTSRDDIREGSRGSSSLFRDRRVEMGLRKFWPNITEESFEHAFKDHVGYPNSVCEHAVPPELAWTSAFPEESTVASVIYNLSKKTLKLCKGPPCTGTFTSYSLTKNTTRSM